jgi:hypothetical protein
MAVVEDPIEIPHVVYPKGPRRRIKTCRVDQDQVAGFVIFATLHECGHEVTLAAGSRDGMPLERCIVRCPLCFAHAHQGESALEGSSA